jgi:hypothetical protein
MHHDVRYYDIAKELMEMQRDTFKKEVGFKPL